MTTGLGCGFAIFFAFALFVRERRMWLGRAELDGMLFRYSRGRYLRRTIGCALLAITMLMVFLGLEVLDFTGHLTFFQLYWAGVGLACLLLLILPVLDIRETYKHFAGSGADERLAAELAKLEALAGARTNGEVSAPPRSRRDEGGPT